MNFRKIRRVISLFRNRNFCGYLTRCALCSEGTTESTFVWWYSYLPLQGCPKEAENRSLNKLYQAMTTKGGLRAPLIKFRFSKKIQKFEKISHFDSTFLCDFRKSGRFIFRSCGLLKISELYCALQEKSWPFPSSHIDHSAVLSLFGLLKRLCITSTPKPSLKIRTPNAICWNSLGLFRDYSLNYIFSR